MWIFTTKMTKEIKVNISIVMLKNIQSFIPKLICYNPYRNISSDRNLMTYFDLIHHKRF